MLLSYITINYLLIYLRKHENDVHIWKRNCSGRNSFRLIILFNIYFFRVKMRFRATQLLNIHK
jgi:hypothetical protein